MRHHALNAPILRTDTPDRAHARAVQRSHRAGRLIRLGHGSYIDRQVWDDMLEADRHLLRARVLAPSLRRTAVFSHMTAALALGWPLDGRAPDRVHVIDTATTGVEHRAGLVRHGLTGLPNRAGHVSFAGVPVTDALPTAVALATTTEPLVAAVAIDHAVRLGHVGVGDLTAALPPSPARGSIRGRLIAAALDPLHESPGESKTAMALIQIGCPLAVPQHPFRHADGTTHRVDFWVPSIGVVIEFDGRQKYRDPRMLGGQDPSEVVWREKLREDRIRAHPEVRAVIRVTWWHLADLDRLCALFRQHGIVF